jgi:hypothetical protein
VGVVLHGLGHEGVFGGGGGKLCERGLRAEGEVARLQEEKSLTRTLHRSSLRITLALASG